MHGFSYTSAGKILLIEIHPGLDPEIFALIHISSSFRWYTHTFSENHAIVVVSWIDEETFRYNTTLCLQFYFSFYNDKSQISPLCTDVEQMMLNRNSFKKSSRSYCYWLVWPHIIPLYVIDVFMYRRRNLDRAKVLKIWIIKVHFLRFSNFFQHKLPNLKN